MTNHRPTSLRFTEQNFRLMRQSAMIVYRQPETHKRRIVSVFHDAADILVSELFGFGVHHSFLSKMRHNHQRAKSDNPCLSVEDTINLPTLPTLIVFALADDGDSGLHLIGSLSALVDVSFLLVDKLVVNT